MPKEAPPKPSVEFPPDALRCDWRTHEARCFLTASGRRGGGRYCDWHLFCLTATMRADDWTEFARFHTGSASYCCELSHWPIDLLWKAAQGLQDLRRGDRRPCSVPWCRHHMVAVAFPKPPRKLVGSVPDDVPF